MVASAFGPKHWEDECFVMLCVQNVCVEPISIVVMMLVSPPHRYQLNEPVHEISNNLVSATRKASDLIRCAV